jgi:hypothetical protein
MEQYIKCIQKEIFMELKKDFNKERGIAMIENLLAKHEAELPEDKSIKDFGGGHVELTKTKASAVVYFGFNGSGNKVSKKLEIQKDEVLLWTEAFAEKLWGNKTDEIISFENFETPTTDEPFEITKESNDSPFGSDGSEQEDVPDEDSFFHNS